MSEWKVLMEKLSGLNRFNRKNNDFIRRFTAGVRTVELDSNGRLQIPRDLIAFAGVKVRFEQLGAVEPIDDPTAPRPTRPILRPRRKARS